jgi:hypothetical protein
MMMGYPANPSIQSNHNPPTATLKSSPSPPPPPPPPPATPPPEPKEPSGLVLALTRLADLEAQMECGFAKHTQLVDEQKKLNAQYCDAFKEDFETLSVAKKAETATGGS